MIPSCQCNSVIIGIVDKTITSYKEFKSNVLVIFSQLCVLNVKLEF